MKHDLICSWLGLPVGKWPPEHYALLGLPPGAAELGMVEQNVQDRLARLRGYQLSHPEEATEGMNRLAQAYLCLTDSAARKAYDQSLAARKAADSSASKLAAARSRQGKSDTATALPPPPALPPAVTDTAVSAHTTVDWRNLPPPVRRTVEAPADDVSVSAPNGAGIAAAPAPLFGEPPSGINGTAIFDLAHSSRAARSGLRTLGRHFDRIYHTRLLLVTWQRLGRYFGKPERRLTRPAEETDLSRRLTELQERMDGFPAILGQPGLPGYRVVAMARLRMMVPLFNHLDPAQRQALARDWDAGLALLRSHRQFLRSELKALRRQSWFGQAARAIRAFIADHPAWVLIGLVLVLAGILWVAW